MKTNIETIDRAETPIQPVREHGDKMSACVPVHLGAVTLSTEAKRGLLDVREATRVVSDWYNEDMDEYIETLRIQGYNTSEISGYEQFSAGWKLDARPSVGGMDFLDLLWEVDGTIHPLQHDMIPVVLHNRHYNDDCFILPSTFRGMGAFPIVYKSVLDPTFFIVNPAKLRRFGEESPNMGVVIDEEIGIA